MLNSIEQTERNYNTQFRDSHASNEYLPIKNYYLSHSCEQLLMGVSVCVVLNSKKQTDVGGKSLYLKHLQQVDKYA